MCFIFVTAWCKQHIDRTVSAKEWLYFGSNNFDCHKNESNF